MKKRILGLWSNEFIRGGAFVTISYTVANLFNVFFTIFAGKQLGPPGYGEITALLSYVTIISVPASVVITIVTQKISSADDNAKTVAFAIEHFLWKTITKFWYIFLLLILISPFIQKITNLSFITSLFLIPIIISSFLLLFYGAILQGIRFFLPFAIITILSALIKLLGPIIAQIFTAKLLVIFIFLFLAFALPTIIIYWGYFIHLKRKTTNGVLSIEKKLSHIILSKQFLITTASVLGITLLNNLDIIIVKKFFTAQEAGIYGSWSLFAKIIFYLVGPLSTISFVFFSSKKQAANHNKTLLIFIGLLIVIGTCSYIFYTYFAQMIIGSLFTQKYYAIMPYLGKASIFGTLYSLIAFINNYFLARKSIGALILPIMTIFYVALLLVFKSSLENIMSINIYVSLGIIVAYFFYIFKSKEEVI